MKKAILYGILSLAMLAGCRAATPPAPAPGGLHVLAIESFLADITRNVAGARAQVDSLIPIGVDPHGYEPIPQDVVKIAQAQVIVANGAGLESWLQRVIENAGGKALLVEASAGLAPRTAGAGEAATPGGTSIPGEDPHFWLDPIDVIRYVENIRDGLTKADPEGKETYAQNAAAYITQLRALDDWI